MGQATDSELAIDSYFAPVSYRVLISGATVTRPTAEALVDQSQGAIRRQGKSREAG
jgi:hypothetical protein